MARLKNQTTRKLDNFVYVWSGIKKLLDGLKESRFTVCTNLCFLNDNFIVEVLVGFFFISRVFLNKEEIQEVILYFSLISNRLIKLLL